MAQCDTMGSLWGDFITFFNEKIFTKANLCLE